ncbi:hypothetical protein SK128_003601, partial [Halocaridina rubra]
MENKTQTLEKVLQYKLDQDITGYITATSISIKEANIGMILVGKVHDIPLADFPKYLLMDDYNQNIEVKVTVEELSVHLLITRSTNPPVKLSGILAKDLMNKRLTGQIVSGNLSFSTVSAARLINEKDDLLAVIINKKNASIILSRDSNVSFVDSVKLDILTVDGPISAEYVND